jgi:predicted permease
MNPFVQVCLGLYRRLAYAFPHEFLVLYGTDVVRLGEDAVDDIWKRHGFFGLVRLVADLAFRVPVEYLNEFRQDAVYAVRTLIKSPGLAAVGIISLGLGIGVSTSAFSEINALMFREIPAVQDPQALVTVESPASYPYFEQYRDQHGLFTGATAFIETVPFAVSLEGAVNAKTERVFGHLVSPEYFSVLGVAATRGRMFTPETDKAGGPPVVVISDRFWRTRLDSDPRVVGRTLKINGKTATIVGVGPKDFLGARPMLAADLFMPVTMPASVAPELGNDALHQRETKAFTVLMRLAPGVSKDTAEVALDTMTRHLDEESFEADKIQKNRTDRRIRLLPGGYIIPMRREDLPAVLGFSGVLMGLVLLIACTNLANMLLARAAARRKEFAIRLAVGAGRFRLIRQLLAESVMLALGGGLAGLVLAFWLTNAVSNMKMPVDLPFQFDVRPDWHVLVFTLLLSGIVGLAFGLAPALAATRADVAPSLKEGAGPELRSYRRFGLRNILVVWQVAGSLMLLMVTGFLVLGFTKSTSINLGIDIDRIYLVSIDPLRDGYSQEQAAALLDKLPERVRRAGGVGGVALSDTPPFTNAIADKAQFASTSTADFDVLLRSATRQSIGTEYFRTLGIPVLMGREFNDHDLHLDPQKGGATPIVINQTAAHELFKQENPLGRRVTEAGRSCEVVGVTRDTQASLFSNRVTPGFYFPLGFQGQGQSQPLSGGVSLVVSGSAGGDVVGSVRREIAAIDPNLTLFRVRTLREQVQESLAYLRIGLYVYGGLGIFGLILASVGLAGVTAYSVARRRKEIGIRMALGASQPQVMRLVLREGFWLIVVGTVFGMLGAAAISRVLSSMLNQLATALQTSTGNLTLIAGAPLLLGALAMIACYIPARSSAKIDPLKALRQE